MDLFQAINQRGSKRAFLSEPVPKELLARLLGEAAKAPSAINLQPWEFTVVSGEEVSRLSRILLKAYKERKVGCSPGLSQPLPEVYRARQYSSFEALAGRLKAGPDEISSFINEGSLSFYGAPAAVIITKEQVIPNSHLTSIGIMIGYLLLSAEALGLATCPVGLINAYSDIILDFLNLEDRDLVLGLAVGRPDPEAPVNEARTPREPVENIIEWYG